MAREKTREEKIKSAYRLKDFRLAESQHAEVKDQAEFAYLDSKLVARDLLKTVLVGALMIGLIIAARSYFLVS